MSLFEDLKNRAAASFEDVSNNVYGYLESRVNDAVVKIGEPAAGNQTAVQIASGQTGGTAPVPSMSSRASIQMPLVLMGVAAAYILLSKRSRG